MKLSEKISYLRKEKGWSQEQLSSKLDVSRQAVYKWEAGIAFPEIDKLKKLCRVFDISFNVLMDDEISLPIINNEELATIGNVEGTTNEAISEASDVPSEAESTLRESSSTCPKCGATINDCFAFCTKCGFALSGKEEESKAVVKSSGGFCTNCGTRLEEGSAFCIECGTPVSDMLIPVSSVSKTTATEAPKPSKKKSQKPLLITLLVILSVIFVACTVLAFVYLRKDDRTFKVTYISDGKAIYTEHLSAGDKISAERAPTKNGYRFEGWSMRENGDVDYSSDDIIISSDDLCLYAVWEAIDYVITYRLDGGTNDRLNPHIYNIGNYIVLNDPKKDDFTFVGWFTDEKMTKPLSQNDFDNGGNIVLYAKWKTNEFVFTYLGDGYLVSSYVGNATTVRIPQEYNGAPVTSIGSFAFLNNTTVKTIVIPKTVESIDATAFDGCTSLSAFNVNEKNEHYCDYENALYCKDMCTIIKYPQGATSIVFSAPTELKRIGPYAFKGASRLEEVCLNDTTEDIGIEGFSDCTSLKRIDTGSSLVFIYDKSFYNCWSLEEITVEGSSLKEIGHRSFENCYELKSVSFPSSLDTIGDSAFKSCSALAEINLEGVCDLGSNVFEKTAISKIFIPNTVKTIGSNLFLSCENAIVLCEASSKPSGWQADWSNGASAVFFNQLGISSSVSSFTFEELGDGSLAIISCIGSGVITVPEAHNGKAVSQISDRAFSGQVGITRIIIPASIKAIGTTAFNDCPSLNTISVNSDSEYFSSLHGILYNKDKTVLYRYPQALTYTTYIGASTLNSIEAYAFYGCKSLKAVVLPNDSTGATGVSTINTGAFEDCTGLESIKLGYLTSTFGDDCFKNCTSLSAISVKCEQVSRIGKNAFWGCTNLRSVDFDGVVEIIDSYAFKNCSSLTAVDLGNPRSISLGAFENCTSLTKILIPGGVEVISYKAFAGCRKLTAYCFANQKPVAWEQGWDTDLLAVVWGAHSLPNTESSFTFTSSGNTVTITGCTNAGVVTIPQTIDGKGVTSIGAGAFSNLYGITEIVIPATVKSIDISAFESCFDLQKITYEGSPTYFGSIDGVLYGDNNKLLLKYPEGKTDESFTVPSRVDIIKGSAFKNNEFIKSITLPSDVNGDNYVGKIEASAFENCISLESIDIGYVNYFERDCFKNCQSLKSILFKAENVWGIGNDAFLGCTSLESIAFLGNVSEIGYQCFELCTSLKSVQFAKNCEKLSSRAFANCTSLKEITLPANLTAVHSETFFACTALEAVTLPSTITKIEADAFKSCVFLKEIYLHKEITSIEKGAFSGCVNLSIKCEADSLPAGWENGWCDDLSKVTLNASKD